MSPQVVVVSGPARAGKTHELVARYHDALTNAPPASLDRQLWIAPSSRTVAIVRELLIDRGCHGTLSPGVTTFDDLSQQIVLSANLKVRPISSVIERELIRRVVAHATAGNRLRFFAAAARQAGSIDLLASHFRELRQRDIRPTTYEKIASARGQSPQRRELALLYAEYDRRLSENGLCDAERIHWAARDALTSGACSRFANVELIFVDGFTDFTRTQLEILRLLATSAKQLFISLPTDEKAANARADLFAKTAATFSELKRYYPKLKEQKLSLPSSTNSALDHISQNVFRYPQPEPSAAVIAALPSINIIEAAGTQDELTQLARKIKSLLSPLPNREEPGEGSSKTSTKGRGQVALNSPWPGEGALPNSFSTQPSLKGRGYIPDDIVVVFRSVAEFAPRVEEVFSRFSIPFSIESAPRIASAPVVRTLSSLLRLDADDWPFRRVVSIITNNTLSAVTETEHRSAEWLVRDLQLASGGTKLRTMVSALATQAGNAEEFSPVHQRRIAAAVAALPAIERIASAIGTLPKQATPTQWTAALIQFGTALGLAPLNNITASGDPTDSAAWQAIVAHFAALERLDSWLGEPTREFSREDLLAKLIDIATHEALPRPHDEIGRVRILSAQSARSVPARHLFLAGMSEQAFPAGARAGQLAGDSEYRFLTNAAHQQDGESTNEPPAAASRAQEEMLLFYEVVSRAQESLTISYPAIDDKAQELPPSPYIVELKRMFRHTKQEISVTKPQLSPVPTRDSIGCVTDWRVAAMSAAAQTDGDRRLLAGIYSLVETVPLGQAIDAGVQIVHARARGDAFGPSEGMLISPAVTAQLGKRFGAKHSWSPSQLETYAACPYKFFLADVLKLEPLGDLALETDFARRGSLLHHVLAAFHRKHSESASGWSELWRDEARFNIELKQTLQFAIDATPREGLEAALLELDRRQIYKWTDAYRGQHEKYDGAWTALDEPPRPAHFELRFGRKHAGEGDDEDASSVDKTFKLDIGGESINISGRIDRIDVGRVGDKTVFNVIDYKSGRRPTLTRDKIESGERLQPALYAMAAQALLFNEGGEPLWAGYWSMQGGVTTNKAHSLHCSAEAGKPADSWNELKTKVIARIGDIVRASRRGDFPVASTDVNCTAFCDFKTVCRIAQVRSVGKVLGSEDPAAGNE